MSLERIAPNGLRRLRKALLPFLVLSAFALGSLGAANAVEQGVPQGNDPPGADEGAAVPGADPSGTLSEQLDRNNGVITPPPTGDTEIHKTAPDPDPGIMRIIPPPGSPGGDPTIQPK